MVIQQPDGTWCVESASTPGHFYTVDLVAGTCECPATRPCWHAQAARAESERRQQAELRRKLKALEQEYPGALFHAVIGEVAP